MLKMIMETRVTAPTKAEAGSRALLFVLPRIGLLCHRFNAKVKNFTHFANTQSNLLQSVG